MEYQFCSMIYDTFRNFYRFQENTSIKNVNNFFPLTSSTCKGSNNKNTFSPFFLQETDSRVICINDTSLAAAFPNIYLVLIRSFFIFAYQMGSVSHSSFSNKKLKREIFNAFE